MKRMISGRSFGGWLALVSALGAGSAAAQPRLYVTNEGSNNVSVIDTTRNVEIHRLDVGHGPKPVEVSPNGRIVYVANHGEDPNSVSAIEDDVVTATIMVGTGPTRVGFSMDSACAYAVNEGSNNISVIDTSSRTVIGTVDTGVAPRPGAATPGGQYGFVLNQGSNDVWVYDLTGGCLPGPPVAQIPVDISPALALVTPDGAFLYVLGFGSDVAVIDLSTFTVLTTVPVEQPSGADLNQNGHVLYVTSGVSNTVFVIDTDPASETFNTVVDAFSVGDVPLDGGFFQPSGRLFIVGNVAGQVFEIDADPQSPTYENIVCMFTLSGATDDDRAAITRNGATIYATNRLLNRVLAIDVSACQVTDMIPVGTNPTRLAVTPF
jgi:YVTN family beta-propeller protein